MGHKKDKNKKKPSIGRELLTIVGTALILSILVRTFLIQAFYVPSASMEDTLQENDRIIVSKISTKLTGMIQGAGWVRDFQILTTLRLDACFKQLESFRQIPGTI